MIKNVVFMGTPDFAVGTLRALIEAPQYHVQAVFCLLYTSDAADE